MKINVYYDEIAFRLRNWIKIKQLVLKVIEEEKKIPGDLSFIFTNDNSLRKINMEFLNRDYFTDVITFDYCENNTVSGEIYISIETARENAKNYKVSYKEEIIRVMIHGILHLLGYDDKTKKQSDVMRKLEDYWIGRI